MLIRTSGSESVHPTRKRAPWIEIGLLNNMPDAALEPTENQFANLLEAAAESLQIRLRFYSLPQIVRGAAASARMEGRYSDVSELWRSRLDALIVTGAEPRAADLRQETYWSSIVEVIEWSRSNVHSAVWSCLAAHAAVLHLDGIQRNPLGQKCCGVFDHEVNRSHPLSLGLGPRTHAPHSRWNQVTTAALTDCGYDILTESPAAGVNLFSKMAGSLFLFWQGHPEYDEHSLLKEYQRDVGRFLRGERDGYPSMPVGYFDASGARAMREFQARAEASRNSELMAEFPHRAAAAGILNTWRRDAVRHYRQWLQMLEAARSMRRTA